MVGQGESTSHHDLVMWGGVGDVLKYIFSGRHAIDGRGSSVAPRPWRRAPLIARALVTSSRRGPFVEMTDAPMS